MKRRDFFKVIAGSSVLWALPAQAKLPSVGFMGNSTAVLEANLVGAFRDGLRELGYEEGRNIIINTAGRRATMTVFRRWSPNCSPPRLT
jgi:putative tryptophan/tyrosine transport system substrate-binding protein